MTNRIFRGEINFLKYIITHPCADPWFTLVETFIPAALKLGITVVSPDWEDVLRWFAQQYDGLPHGKGSKRKRHVPSFNLPLDHSFGPAWTNKLLTQTLFITAPLETFGFWWLVYNATDRFFSDWQSLLQKNNFCSRDPSTGPLQRRGDDIGAFFNSNLDSNGLPTILQNRAPWSTNAFGCEVPGGQYWACYEANWERPEIIGPLEGCRLWLRISSPGRPDQVEYSETFTIPAGSRGQGCVTAKFQALGINNLIEWGSTGPGAVAAVTGGKGSVRVIGLG